MEFLEDVTKEIDSFPIMEKIPGGKAFLVSFVYDKLTKTHNLAKTDQGLELRDKEDPSQVATLNHKALTFKSFLEETLEPFLDKKVIQNELEQLIKSQSKVRENAKKAEEEAKKNNAYNPYHYSLAYQKASRAAEANKKALERLSK